MKKTTTIATFLLGGILSLNAQNLVVIGEVENVKDGTEFYLQEPTSRGIAILFNNNADENNGKVINGHFILNHKCSRADSRHFALFSDSPGFHNQIKLDFWANQGDTIYVKGKTHLFGNWEIQSKAPEQKEWDVLRKASAKEQDAYQQALLDYEAYRQYRRNTQLTEAEWDSTGVVLAQKDKLRTETKIALQKKQLEAMKHLPVTDFWMEHLGTILEDAKFHRKEFEDIIKEIYIQNAAKIDRKPDGQAIRSWVYPYPKAELGKLYKGGELFDIHGKKYRLEDFRGKFILLDFWAQYCFWCIDAFPQIKSIQEKYTDKLVAISISVDQINTWKASPEQKNITWYSLNDGGGTKGGIAGSFDIKALPTYILIAPDGTYKARLNSSDIENGNIEKYLNGEL